MSKLLDYLGLGSHNSANTAKERLKIIVAHERGHSTNGQAVNRDYLPLLQQELLKVVRKYVAIEDKNVKISMEKEGDYEVLELNIALPEQDK